MECRKIERERERDGVNNAPASGLPTTATSNSLLLRLFCNCSSPVPQVLELVMFFMQPAFYCKYLCMYMCKYVRTSVFLYVCLYAIVNGMLMSQQHTRTNERLTIAILADVNCFHCCVLLALISIDNAPQRLYAFHLLPCFKSLFFSFFLCRSHFTLYVEN